jgi:hypothetical protein
MVLGQLKAGHGSGHLDKIRVCMKMGQSPNALGLGLEMCAGLLWALDGLSLFDDVGPQRWTLLGGLLLGFLC